MIYLKNRWKKEDDPIETSGSEHFPPWNKVLLRNVSVMDLDLWYNKALFLFKCPKMLEGREG